MEEFITQLSSQGQQYLATVQKISLIFLFGLLLERFLAADRNQPWRNIAFNLVYILFFFAVSIFVTVHVFLWSDLTANWFEPIFSIPAGQTWLQGFLQALVFFLGLDFFYYWFHRMQHKNWWLWQQHKLHHSEQSLNITSTNRHHWLEPIIRPTFVIAPMAILFDFEPAVYPVIWSVMFLGGYFIHMNIRLPLGPLTPVWVGPQLHRLHHSIEPEHKDCNFAAFFPIWDLVFGTYVAPPKRRVSGHRSAFGRNNRHAGQGHGFSFHGLVRRALPQGHTQALQTRAACRT